MPRRTLPQIEERHDTEIRDALRGALERNHWRALAAADELGLTEQRMHRLIEKHGLREEYSERNPGRGRPRLRDRA